MARRIDLDVLGIVATGLLVAVAVAILAIPGAESVLPAPIRALDDVLPAEVLAWLLAIGLGLVAFWGLVRIRPARREDGNRFGHAAGGSLRDADEPTDNTTNGPAGGSTRSPAGRTASGAGGRTQADADREPRIVGQTTTDRYERMADTLRSLSGCPEPGPLTALQDAAIALEQSRGYDVPTARERVQRGAWTTDPVAAAFLGEPDAGELTLRQRLYGAVYPGRAFERRFERTLRALESVAAEELDAGRGTADPGETARDRSQPGDGADADVPADASEAADGRGGTDASGAAQSDEIDVDADGVA